MSKRYGHSNKDSNNIKNKVKLFKKNMFSSGGAQTIMKNVDWVFWQKVYILSEKLFTELTELNRQKVSCVRTENWISGHNALQMNS